jgi:hypothetical protein
VLVADWAQTFTPAAHRARGIESLQDELTLLDVYVEQVALFDAE